MTTLRPSLRLATLASVAMAFPCLALCEAARADSIVLETADYWNHGGNGGWSATPYGGGEFRVKNYSGPPIRTVAPVVVLPGSPPPLFPSVFQTFCIEYSEEFYTSTQYFFDINTGAVRGGAGGQLPPPNSNFDPLDPRTAYLFTKFWTGTLANYHYAVSPADNLRVASATALQLAIWYLENELNSIVSPAALAAYNSPTIGSIGERARAWVLEATNANWTTIGDVRVMNLYTVQGGNRIPAQDQLVMLVPLPPTAMLGWHVVRDGGNTGRPAAPETPEPSVRLDSDRVGQASSRDRRSGRCRRRSGIPRTFGLSA